MNNMNPAAMSMLQQQIFGQYAMMNGLLGEPPNKRMKPSNKIEENNS